MIDADLIDRLLYAAVGILGAMALLWLQKLLSRFFLPEPPSEIADLEAEIWRNTFSGEGYGDSDIDRLDMALTRAELEKPGSTMRINYDSLPAVMGRQVGSLVVSFIVCGWVLHILPVGPITIVVLAFAVGALVHPFASWALSRPRR